MRSIPLVPLLLVLYTQPDYALNVAGGAHEEIGELALQDRSWSKRSPLVTRPKSITLSDYFKGEKSPNKDETDISRDRSSVSSYGVPRDGGYGYSTPDDISHDRGSVPGYGTPDDDETDVLQDTGSVPGSGMQDDVGSALDSSMPDDKEAAAMQHEAEKENPMDMKAYGGSQSGESTSDTLKRGESVVAQMGGKRRNLMLFLICSGAAIGVICFAVLKFINRGKPDKPLFAGSGEQSTLMSEMFPRAPNRWERRGAILGIGISLATLSGLALNAVAMHPIYGNLSNWMQCHRGGPYGINWWEAQYCTYVSAYIWTAPQLTLAVALLIFGRGILQHRLYYAVLKNGGGVLDYHRSTAFADPLFLLLMFWYAHSLLYMGFIGYLLVLDNGNKAAEDKDRMKLVNFLLYAFVPFTVFVIFTFTKYSLELYLVPLSEFVDADGGQKNLLGSLRVIDESTAREVLMESCQKPSPLNQEMADQAKYAATVQLCMQKQTEKGGDCSQPSHLMNYLWPSIILMSRKTLGNNAALFRIVWWIYLAFAVFLLCASILFLVFCCYRHMLSEQFLFLPSAVIMIGVLVWTLGSFLKTVTHR